MVLLETYVWLLWLLGDGVLRDMKREVLNRLVENRHLAVSWLRIWETE